MRSMLCSSAYWHSRSFTSPCSHRMTAEKPPGCCLVVPTCRGQHAVANTVRLMLRSPAYSQWCLLTAPCSHHMRADGVWQNLLQAKDAASMSPWNTLSASFNASEWSDNHSFVAPFNQSMTAAPETLPARPPSILRKMCCEGDNQVSDLLIRDLSRALLKLRNQRHAPASIDI